MKTNVIVNETISIYNDISYEIDDIFMEYAMESENESVDDNENKENFAKRLLGTVTKLINEIYAIIDRFVNHVRNVLYRVAQTDVGFRDNCRQAMKDNKPYEAVKLIVYNYNDQYLESQVNKITRECTSILTSMNRDYQIKDDESDGDALDMKKKDIVKYILIKIGCPSNVTDMNMYFELIKKNFRVEKKEMLFKASLGNVYYNKALEIENIKKVTHDRQTVMKNQAATIKSELMNIVENNTTQDHVKKRAVRYYRHAAGVYNFYTAFLKVYIQFKIEETLMYRAVLKKLFHFQ